MHSIHTSSTENGRAFICCIEDSFFSIPHITDVHIDVDLNLCVRVVSGPMVTGGKSHNLRLEGFLLTTWLFGNNWIQGLLRWRRQTGLMLGEMDVFPIRSLANFFLG